MTPRISSGRVDPSYTGPERRVASYRGFLQARVDEAEGCGMDAPVTRDIILALRKPERVASEKAFEEALDDYLRAEHELSLQFSLDGMDQGGPLKLKAKAKRLALFAAHAEAIKEAVEKERERCALVAELSAPPYDGTTDTRQIHGASMASMIAAAIREGGKP